MNGRREHELLLACARRVVDDATAERIRTILRGNMDWPYALKQAEQHRVMPLLYQSLSTVCPSLVPTNVLTNLREYTKANVHHNLYRTRELLKLLSLLEANNIPSLPFKGPVLSALAYGNLGLREYGDLDVLVRHQDVLRTKGLLIQEGYSVVSRSDRSAKEPDVSPRNKDLIFHSADGRVRVELHWRLTGKHFDFSLDPDSLWERLEKVSLAGSRVRTLAPQDLLLYLSMHGSRHGWERLLWVCDVAELIRTSSDLDWASVREEATKLGCERSLALGLFLAHDLLDTQLPWAVWHEIQVQPEVRALAAETSEMLFHEGELGQDISYWYDMHLRVRERRRDRLRLHLYYWPRYFRLAVKPNERDRAILALPSFLSSLYYLIRPLRLFERVVSAGLKKRIRWRVD
jgi:hypothetical protein